MGRTRQDANWNALRRSPGLDLEAWTSSWTSHAQTRHTHNQVQLSLTREGSGSFWIGESRTESPPGHLVIIPPGQVHSLSPAACEAWRFDTVYLPEASFAEVAPGTRADPALAKTFLRVHDAIARDTSRLTLEVEILDLVELLVRGIHEHSLIAPRLPERGHASLERVRDYLESCPDDGVDLAQLAAIAGLSPYHFSRSFRRAFGMPPHAYLLQARVSRARALLRQGEPVCEVAARLGFADQAHLTRHFRRLTGVTPGRYRDASKNVQDGRVVPS